VTGLTIAVEFFVPNLKEDHALRTNEDAVIVRVTPQLGDLDIDPSDNHAYSRHTGIQLQLQGLDLGGRDVETVVAELNEQVKYKRQKSKQIVYPFWFVVVDGQVEVRTKITEHTWASGCLYQRRLYRLLKEVLGDLVGDFCYYAGCSTDLLKGWPADTTGAGKPQRFCS